MTVQKSKASAASRQSDARTVPGGPDSRGGEPVAVVGLACRLPGAPSPAEFWQLLREGRDAVGPAADSRREAPGGALTGSGPAGYLDRVDTFDAPFFGISPREARAMDPQQRLMLELSWEALEHAGIVPGDLRDTRTAVFASSMWDDYAELAVLSGANNLGPHSFAGTRRTMLANRVSYLLGLNGPSLTVDSGQSSSLVAVHLACESLRRGEATAALVGGVNLILGEGSVATSAAMGAMSPSGRCRTFDSRADGYVRGEGGAVLVLKPLSIALADGDPVHCVIRGSAVNNDGGGDNLTAPRREAQEEVLRLAHERAGTRPDHVRYVELHGTGTPVGDPIEAAALGAVLGAARPVGDPLYVGSVKTNIGHLESAAGIAALLKVVLSLSRGELPPSLNYAEPNPGIPLDTLNLRVRTECGPWPGEDEQPLAGVSSFGLGGTNCHVVLAKFAPDAGRNEEPAAAPTDQGVLAWPLSGASREALAAQSGQLAAFLADGGVPLPELGASLAGTRTAFRHRAVVVGRERAELMAGLSGLAAGELPGGVVSGVVGGDAGPVFVFPGQGSQWVGMGLALAAEFPVFREALAECERVLSEHVDWSLRELLGSPALLLGRADAVQPALWAVMVSLARLWESFGVVPSAVVGHSQGEIAAAVVAGALSLEDGARVVALRSQVLDRRLAGRGGMASIALAREATEELTARWAGRLSVGAVNGPSSTVVSGELEALDELDAECAAREVRVRRIPVDYASHSVLVEAVREELLQALAGVRPRPCVVPFLSTVTGKELQGPELDAEYWYTNLRSTVEFADATRILIERGHDLFVEVSPHPVLVGSVAETAEVADTGVDARALGTLRRDDGVPERFLASLAQAWAHGAHVAWDGLFEGYARRRVELPTYPFQRESHWLEGAGSYAPPPLRQPTAETDAADEYTARSSAAASVPGLAGRNAGQQRELLTDLVRRHTAAVLGHADSGRVDRTVPFKEAGFDSHMSVELRDRLNSATGLRLPSGVLFSHPTPAELAERLRTDLVGDPDGDLPTANVGAADEPIAIVGMACRFPGGVAGPEDLWQLVAEGRDAVGDFPTDRGWDLDALYDPDPEHHGSSYTRKGGFLDSVAEFDAPFFGISPREAQTMDPQQRLMLETSWEAIERAGIAPPALRGTPTGVFVGAMAQEYGAPLHQAPEGLEGQLLTGNAASVLSGRVSYTLGFNGPAITVDTACSSSLVAIHLAAQALRQGDCSMALAGGVTVMPNPGMFLEFSRQRGLSPDGRCKAFAAAADGTGWGEGVGVLVLQRLSEARRAGHRVLAVLRGSAINQDGASNGLTAPNGSSQEHVIRQALAAAGLDGADVDAVEAHGTGTTLGDPIEATALLATYGRGRNGDDPLHLGSLKSNIGHAQAAAGVGGVVKMVMAMREGTLPRTLHVDQPSPHVDWSSGGLSLLVEPLPWPERDRPRRAAVSSFGISGTNAHVILEAPSEPSEPPEPFEPAGTRPSRPETVLWPLSATSRDALAAQARRLAGFVGSGKLSLRDVGASLATTRAAFRYRAVVVGRGLEEMTAGLSGLAARESPGGVVSGEASGDGVGPVFVFPGQGSQWAGMGLELAAEFPVFREALQDCGRALSSYVEWDLWKALGSDELLERVDVVQPTLWAVMVSLARLWESFGVVPAAVVGHSQGEIAAAVVAGALSLEDGARVVGLRSRVIAERLAGKGGMASAALDRAAAEELAAKWGGRLSVAVVNGPSSTVVAGEPSALEEFVAACEKREVRVRRVAVDYASHSPQVEAVRDELLAVLDGVRPGVCTVPFLSTVTGEALAGPELDAEYWYTNLRSPVDFAEVTRTLIGQGHRLFVEASAHPVLAMAIEENAEDEVAAVGTLRRDDGGSDRFLTSLAQVHVNGGPVDWPAVHPGARAVELPTYPFQHQRYWMTSPAPGNQAQDHPLAETVVPLAGGDGALLVATLSRRTMPWLTDHAVKGAVLLPGTAFVELALKAGEAAGCGRLEEITLHAPLRVPERGSVQLQLAVHGSEDTEAAGRGYTFTAHSRRTDAGADEPWTSHATGVLTPVPAAEPAVDAPAWPPAGAEPVEIAELYPGLAELGYDYGPAFQGVKAAWRLGDEVFTEVALHQDQLAEAAHFGLHPALLDGALHGTLLDSLAKDTPDLTLPFSFSGVELHASGASTSRVRITPQGPDAFTIRLTDTVGRTTALIESLVMRSADQRAAGGPVDGLYRIDWVPAAELASEPAGERWQVLSPETPDLSALRDSPPAVVVLPVPAGRGVSEAVGGTLALMKEWLADERFSTSRLVFALSGDRPEQAAVAGLVRSAQNEQPGQFTLVHTVDDPEFAFSAAAGASGEPELRVNGRQAAVPRLTRAARRLIAPPEEHWRLGVSDAGEGLDAIVPVPAPRAGAQLPEGCVRVAVGAAGLNFRDLVVALRMVPGLEGVGVEGAGTVTEVGPDVEELRVGDRVMGMLPEAMGPVAVADARTLTRMPDGWTFEQGASVPVAFLTAWMGLVDLAGLSRGDRVLIHAATGGLGLAALQVARSVGAEIFATASPAKHHLLRDLGLGDDHIASSRDLDFRDRFLATTGGAGLDVVMNVLSGEFTDASLDLLPNGGRFVEMGKTDIRDADAVAAGHQGVRYQYFDLMSESPDRVRGALRHLHDRFADGSFKPPLINSWPIDAAHEAFDTLRRANHLGKLVLTTRSPWRAGRTVLITGGTGTLGALLARHLVSEHGVRHLLLTSRRGPAAEGAAELIEELARLGAEARAVACDVADRASLGKLLASIPAEQPLGAVVHAAGLLDDATVEAMTAEQVERVLRAKAAAALLLDELTEGADLDAFVLYSSVAGVLGTAGQANYAAANAVLDALARDRRGRGLPAVSLAWGLWQQASGMTGHLDGQDMGRLSRTGIAPLEAAEGLALFDQAMADGGAGLVAARLDLAGLRQQAAAGQLSAVLRGLVGSPRRRVLPAADRSVASGERTLTERLADVAPTERQRVLLDLVRSHAAAVLRHGTAEDVEPDRPFRDVGFDSLTAVELRNRVNAATGLKLPSTVVFRHPTPTQLMERLDADLFPQQKGVVATDILNDLDRLRTALAGLEADEADRRSVAVRLRALLAGLEDDPGEDAASQDGNDALATATDDEMFALINKELGIE
ncbi:SDR family NAD(P)-dependent oxidoreductase [Streptomyces johnsoniae]|uniref:SDR family NAD(P)-dependent oxidoreductase n=1 Tax=Streptomyces johnsoniae TaxID=3075532 RepID=A0ABU2S0P0_9ACTN|nr:SDR family NAD(P)-dependent oxidoreductase [Streptomyces sp. DSM 41886]MDT0442562.1 SDR family NAD(P)-dependent oxidoreductase [Streptomyces sp. DSM 41886]